MTKHPANEPENDGWLDRVWQAAPPPEPGEAAWADVLSRIQANVPRRAPAPPARAPRPSGSWSRPVLWLGAVAAVAAGVLLAVVLSGVRPRPHATQPVPHVEPWPVASDDDVDILSMDAGDFMAVVVGQPPHRGPIVLATAEDVLIDDTGHDVQIHVPEDWKGGQPAAPMIIMPLDSGPGKH